MAGLVVVVVGFSFVVVVWIFFFFFGFFFCFYCYDSCGRDCCCDSGSGETNGSVCEQKRSRGLISEYE